MNLDGSNPKLLTFEGHLESPKGIAPDLVARKMYHVNDQFDDVIVASLDGANTVVLGNIGGFLR